MTNWTPGLRRLGIARQPGDLLWEAVSRAGWEPRPCFATEMVATDAPMPCARPRALILLSPSGARFAALPTELPILATGEGTAQALGDREVWTPATPNAEGLWELLQARFPQGGDFVLVRAERSRNHLEQVAQDTPWHLHPWITHAERPANPIPNLSELDAVLALSPLQAELLGPLAESKGRIAWGPRTAAAFQAIGYPAHATSEPRTEALQTLLMGMLAFW